MQTVTVTGSRPSDDFAPPVADFIASIFAQLREQKTELTFGFTDALCRAGQDVFQPVFARMNNPGS